MKIRARREAAPFLFEFQIYGSDVAKALGYPLAATPMTLYRFIAYLNDNVLIGVAAVISENINSADIARALFNADAKGGKVTAVEFKHGKGNLADQSLVYKSAPVVDTNLF